MMWCSSYLRNTRKISTYLSGCFDRRLVRKLPAERCAKCSLRSVTGGHPTWMARQVPRQSRGHRGRAKPAWLALAKHDVGQQLPELGSTIGQWHQHVQQRRFAVPVANPFAEAEDLFEARVEPPVVFAQPCFVYA